MKARSFLIKKLLRFWARRTPLLRQVFPKEMADGRWPDFNASWSRLIELENTQLRLFEACETFKRQTKSVSMNDLVKEDQLLVSVIMPIFQSDVSKLRLAIQSVRSQTYPRYELLIIYYGVLPVLDGLEDQADSKIRWLASDQANAPYQRNLGIQQALGDIIAYLDDDNVWYPYYLEYIVAAYAHPQVQSTYTAQIVNQIDGNLQLLKAISFDKEKFLIEGGIDGNVYAHRTELYAQYGGWDTELNRLQDLDLILRYSQAAPPYFVPIVGGEYLENRPGSISVTQPFFYNLWMVKKKNLKKFSPSFRVLTLLASYRQISDRNIYYDLQAVEAYGIDIAVWAPVLDKALQPESHFKMYHGDLEKAIKDFQPDIINSYGLSAVTFYQEVLDRYNIPITIRNLGFENNQIFIAQLTGSKNIKRIFVLPEALNRFYPEEKLFVLPTSIHSELFIPSSEKNKRQVIQYGSSPDIKSLEGFIQIALKCPEFEFVLVLPIAMAAVDIKQSILSYNHKRGNPVKIIGPAQIETVAKVIRSAGIYLCPQHSDNHFAMSLAIKEALAASCIVLVQESEGDRPYYAEVVQYFRSPQDAAKLIKASSTWTDDYWKTQGARNSEFVFEHFTAIDTMKPVITYWQELLLT